MAFFVSSTGFRKRRQSRRNWTGRTSTVRRSPQKAGAGNRMWRVYLSTSGPDVHARDRIGNGPWHNAKGILIAVERRGAALGQGEYQQRHRARRAGPHDQPAGRAKPARHPDGLHARRQGHDDDLSELDEQQQRAQRDAGASRSAAVRQARIALELGPPVERMLAGESGGDRGSRPDLLLRRQLTRLFDAHLREQRS